MLRNAPVRHCSRQSEVARLAICAVSASIILFADACNAALIVEDTIEFPSNAYETGGEVEAAEFGFWKRLGLGLVSGLHADAQSSE